MGDPKKPFSTQWYQNPAGQRAHGRVGASLRSSIVDALASRPWIRFLPMLALVALVVLSPFFVYPRTILPIEVDAPDRSDLTLAAVPTVRPANASISTGRMSIGTEVYSGPLSAGTEEEMVLAVAEPTKEPALEGTLLPEHRILLVYGLPGDSGFGMLGSYENLRLLEILQEKRDEFQALDPDRPIVLGFQIISSLAQKTPGNDGSYLKDTSVATIYTYIEFTRNHDMLLFLDLQIGRRAVPDDVRRMRGYLSQPHVHLAIDPEFDVERTEIPTQDIGSTTAADITWVQDFLANIVLESAIPPKILIVHQWEEGMIVNRTLLRPVRGVQLVISVSIWGGIEEKQTTYTTLIADNPVEFGGIMISSARDDEVMIPNDVVNLPRAPEIVIYH